MDRLKLIPEMNYWMGIVLGNSPLNEHFFKVPVVIDDQEWRSPHSVLDLLFNETFEPREPGFASSSSSSSPWDGFDGFRFSWGFRKADLSKIRDRNVLRRITIYAGNLDIWVANIPENEHMFATYHSTDFPGMLPPYSPTTEELFKAYSETNKGIVSGTCIPYRSSLTLIQQELLGEYFPPVNIFGITDQEVGMLEKLYEYKSELPVTLDDCPFEDLTDCLAKLIYVYLDWELNESMVYYDMLVPISDGSRILCSLYEKYVLDHLYRVISKKYNVTYSEDRCDNFVELDHDFLRAQLTPDQEMDKEIVLPSDEIPYDGFDIYLVHNGKMQTYPQDFDVKIVRPDEADQTITEVSIIWQHDRYVTDDEIYILWSFLNQQSLAEYFETLNP